MAAKSSGDQSRYLDWSIMVFFKNNKTQAIDKALEALLSIGKNWMKNWMKLLV